MTPLSCSSSKLSSPLFCLLWSFLLKGWYPRIPVTKVASTFALGYFILTWWVSNLTCSPDCSLLSSSPFIRRLDVFSWIAHRSSSPRCSKPNLSCLALYLSFCCTLISVTGITWPRHPIWESTFAFIPYCPGPQLLRRQHGLVVVA